MQLRRKLIAVSVAGLAVAGAGGAVAASKLSSPKEQNQAVLNDAANELGVQPSELSAALRKAYSNRVDEAIKAGRLTKAEGDALKARINSGDFPLFGVPGGALGGPRFEHGPFGLIGPDPMGELSTAADYLGLTEAQLRTKLNSGKTLAQIAKAQDKSVDGLVDKLVDRKKDRIQAAVKDGKLTQAQADRILADLKEAVTDFVNNGRLRFEFRGGGKPDFDFHGRPDGPRFGAPDDTLLPAA
jgi:CRISPR/Cas system-associated endoribonuclease Cas2